VHTAHHVHADHTVCTVARPGLEPEVGIEPTTYRLLTQVSRSPLANVCDTNYSAVTRVEKSLLPAADAYGGMHRHLREQATLA
jgi:hypothetical protein